MTTSEFVARTYLLATGKTTALATTNAKYTRILAIGNMFIEQWVKEPGIDWASLFDYVRVGTISATDSFDLTNADSTINKISQQPGDYIKILHSNGAQESEYELVTPDRLREYRYSQVVARAGNNLIFPTSFTTTSPEFGGTLIVPAYVLPEPISAPSDDIPVDDPNWLCYITAAEFVRNDRTKQDQFANLISYAQESMNRMKLDNYGQESTISMPWSAGGGEYTTHV